MCGLLMASPPPVQLPGTSRFPVSFSSVCEREFKKLHLNEFSVCAFCVCEKRVSDVVLVGVWVGAVEGRGCVLCVWRGGGCVFSCLFPL